MMAKRLQTCKFVLFDGTNWKNCNNLLLGASVVEVAEADTSQHSNDSEETLFYEDDNDNDSTE